ncbi:MAG: hypothetical protein NWF05_04945 [Candidatus Bathyarchaeota archaeon]|nr:hypothetical protein [Candidatus Bathyarchaeota archaeon]
MGIPKIVEHKIITMRKRDGSTQYTLTLPKEFAETLRKEGIDSLYIVFDRGLGAFPKIPGFTEKALTKFMQEHEEIQKLFINTTEHTGGN